MRQMAMSLALQILIDHTVKDCIEAGCGIRSIPSFKAKRRIFYAIKRVYKQAYGVEPDEEKIKRMIYLYDESTLNED